jgi:hypothetical protein
VGNAANGAHHKSSFAGKEFPHDDGAAVRDL